MSHTHLQRVRILYKTILRLHRGLPSELRPLGDGYAKDEFKRHRKCTVAEADKFMIEWTKYAVGLAKQLQLGAQYKNKGLGTSLNSAVLENMNDEQINQLYELMLAAHGDSDKFNNNIKEQKNE